MNTALHTALIEGVLDLHWSRKGDSGIVQLHGAEGDEDTRIELIERSMRGEQIELLMRARTYAQGEQFTCSQPIEMSATGMDTWAERAPGTPFQFDHSHAERDCGGFCTESAFQHLGGDSYELLEGIVLNTPRAVQGALRGNIRKFSISLTATHHDTILCSYCDKPYFQCEHFAGDVIDGVMVRLVYTDTVPIERSSVTFPAVTETGVMGWEQLSALFPSKHHEKKGTRMELSVLISTLGIAADSDESAVLQAIAVMRSERGELSAQVEKLSADLAERDAQVEDLSGKLASLEADKVAAQLDGKIAALKADARITDAQEGIIRELFDAGHTESAMNLAASFESAPKIAPTGPRQSLPADDAGSNRKPPTATAAGDIDWHALAKEVPAHVRKLGGQALATDPRGYIELNKHKPWAKALGIDWATVPGQE